MKKALAMILCLPLLTACAQQTVLDSADPRSDAEQDARFMAEALQNRTDSAFAQKAAESGSMTVCTLTDLPD